MVSVGGADVTSLNSRLSAMENGPVTQFPAVKAAAEIATFRQEQREIATIGADGKAKWTFITPYDTEPAVSHIPSRMSDGSKVFVEIDGTVGTNGFDIVAGKYVAVTVIASRLRKLPAITPLSTLLTLTNVNAALAQLSEFDIFGGATPVGARVHLWAGVRSSVPLPVT